MFHTRPRSASDTSGAPSGRGGACSKEHWLRNTTSRRYRRWWCSAVRTAAWLHQTGAWTSTRTFLRTRSTHGGHRLPAPQRSKAQPWVLGGRRGEFWSLLGWLAACFVRGVAAKAREHGSFKQRAHALASPSPSPNCNRALSPKPAQQALLPHGREVPERRALREGWEGLGHHVDGGAAAQRAVAGENVIQLLPHPLHTHLRPVRRAVVRLPAGA